MKALDGLVDHPLDTDAFIFRHGGGGACFVKEHGTVDDEEVVGRGHVSHGFWVDKVVECREERFGGVNGFIDEPSVRRGGVDKRHMPVGIVLTVALEGQGPGDGSLIGESVDIEAEIVICQEEACFEPGGA